MLNKNNLIKINEFLWEIPKSFRKDMRVPARVYATESMLNDISSDKSLEQLVNVAALPGIKRYSIAMPDIHEGYGFPIGGVAAFDIKEGVISPGGIGYDINCGVRLLRSEKKIEEIKPVIEKLAGIIYEKVPSGLGKEGTFVFKNKELNLVLEKGARRIIELGYGEPDDLCHIESEGGLNSAIPEFVSEVAKKRGYKQLGTMGAGNHFIEIGVVETIFDEQEARKLNIFKNQVIGLIHTGSRGLGHQIATDYIRVMMRAAMSRYGITLQDRELACVPFLSKEGQEYWGAMSAGANFAWANRQLITWEVRKAWKQILGEREGKLDIVYDVAHNIAKVEEYADINNKKEKLVVHRKGATRAFPGQPVLIPGSMGTFSYVLIGQEKSLSVSFGSTCHGAGRRMSRTASKKQASGQEIKEKLLKMGIVIKTGLLKGLAEESPAAYKDVNEVVDVIDGAGIAKKIVRLRPIAVIKG